MREGREERFEGLEYRQEVSNGYERVNASNSCVRILIFSSSSFIVFMLVFFFLFILFHLFCVPVFLSFPLFLFGFLCFSAHVCFISSLLNLRGTKRFGCCTIMLT
jgi:hypothetical protein